MFFHRLEFFEPFLKNSFYVCWQSFMFAILKTLPYYIVWEWENISLAITQVFFDNWFYIWRAVFREFVNVADYPHSRISLPGFILPILFCQPMNKNYHFAIFLIIIGFSGYMILILTPISSFASRAALASKETLKFFTSPPGNFHQLSSPCLFKRAPYLFQ